MLFEVRTIVFGLVDIMHVSEICKVIWKKGNKDVKRIKLCPCLLPDQIHVYGHEIMKDGAFQEKPHVCDLLLLLFLPFQNYFSNLL